MIDLLKKTDRECTIALQQPNRDVDAYRAYYEGRQSLAKELLLKWQQCAVSGSLALLAQRREELLKLLDETQGNENIKWQYELNDVDTAMQVISGLSANDR